MRRLILGKGVLFASVVLLVSSQPSRAQRVSVSSFGVMPNSPQDATPGVNRAITSVKSLSRPVLIFPKGRYEFWPENAPHRKYFISNHDPVESRAVAMPLEGVDHLIVDGQGSIFIFHGLILPISIVHGHDITLRNLSIDYATPHVLNTEVVHVGDDAVDLQVPAGENYVVEDHHICAIAEEWGQCLGTSQEFDGETKAIAWNTHADLNFANVSAVALSSGMVRVSGMPIRPLPGNRLILWNRDRPNPAIWVSESNGVSVNNVSVFSAQGMGFLAQKSADIHLDGFRVKLSDRSTRYVTSVADAVHFSNCKGKLLIENGLYENMLDDGINVHGDYLRIASIVLPDTVLLEWVNPQTFGFTFAVPSEHIQFVKSSTLLGYGIGIVKGVSPVDAQHVQLTFVDPLPTGVQVSDAVVNTDWQPSVIYRNNTVRRNRSRGTIFKTTKGVLVEGNTFDHLSGPAILLIADAIDWFESQPASGVVITGNYFIDQVSTYGPAPITISPRVSLSDEHDRYNVRRIVISNNVFSVFQRPLLVATSVDGLVFRRNTVRLNTDFKPFQPPDAAVFSIHHSRCIDAEHNDLPWTLTDGDVALQDSDLVYIADVSSEADHHSWLSRCQTMHGQSASR